MYKNTEKITCNNCGFSQLTYFKFVFVINYLYVKRKKNIYILPPIFNSKF